MQPSTFILAFFTIAIIQRLLETFARREKAVGTVEKGWTFTFLFILHAVMFFGALAEYFVYRPSLSPVVSGLGLLLYISGLAGRNWAIRTLGRYWSLHIEIRERHKLVMEGPYKYLRHPAYLSIIFEVVGIPLVANAYLTLIFVLISYIPVLLIRMYYEEKKLINKFGQEYMDYKARTWALFPTKKLTK